MGRNGYKKKKRGHWIILLILVLAVLALVLFFRTRLAEAGEEQMESYTVGRGTVETYKSFSATLSVRNSETFTNTEGVTMVKELYVTSGQEVKKGDQILMLGTGKVYEASISGFVNELRFKKGDYLWPGITLAQVCDLEHLQVSLQVDEYDVDKVEVGQQCVVTIIPLGLEYETEIVHVNRLSASSGGVAYYPVTAYLDAPENVLPGMTVSVRLQDEKAEDVLTLPMTALTFDEDGNPCVQMKQDGEYVLKTVTVGLTDGMTVEITEGVSEGDTVYARSVAAEEESVSAMDQLLRTIFGTHVVINEENAGRGERGSRGGQGAPGFDGAEMPEGMNPFEMASGENTVGEAGQFPARANPEEGQSLPDMGTRQAAEVSTDSTGRSREKEQEESTDLQGQTETSGDKMMEKPSDLVVSEQSEDSGEAQDRTDQRPSGTERPARDRSNREQSGSDGGDRQRSRNTQAENE